MPERAGLSHAIFPRETDVAYRQTTDRHQNVALRALCAMASVTTKLKKRAQVCRMHTIALFTTFWLYKEFATMHQSATDDAAVYTWTRLRRIAYWFCFIYHLLMIKVAHVR